MDQPNDSAIDALVAPVLDAMGYALVRVRLSGKQTRTLQVMVERADGAAMTVDDCAAVSRALAPALDVADPIAGAYTLEVSSPGIDRPLVRRGDYTRFAGHEARIETREEIGGRKRFRGRLLACAEPVVRIDIGGAAGVVELPFAAIRSARLVLTDALVAAGETRPPGGAEPC